MNPRATSVAVALVLCLGTTAVATAATKVPGPFVAVQVDYYEGTVDPLEIEAGTPGGGEKVSEGRGSGVVVGSGDDGVWYVLTNAHVVEGDSEAWYVHPRVYAGAKWRTGVVVATDAAADLALIELPYAGTLRVATLADGAPDDRAHVKTHGFAAGRKYRNRETELRHSLKLDDGVEAFASQRYFIRTTFQPGESGGAITIDGKLVGLIHGNDPEAERGICVDYDAIETFLAPHLPEVKTASFAE
jgi:S1-C subfamily serine protease